MPRRVVEAATESVESEKVLVNGRCSASAETVPSTHAAHDGSAAGGGEGIGGEGSGSEGSGRAAAGCAAARSV